MSASSRTSWFWSDWLGDLEVRRLTLAERGLWIDLLALAATAAPTGYVCDAKGRPLTLEEITRITNAGSPDEVAKLIDGILDKGAASRDRSGRLFNRRMVRDAEIAARKRLGGQLGGKSTRLKWLEKTSMPQQMPRQTNGPPIPINRITSSFTAAAKEQPKEGLTLREINRLRRERRG